jgi:hypothetical protein
MEETLNYSEIELVLHVAGDGTEENVYRKKENGKYIFYNSYSHEGISKKDDFWSGHQERFDDWNEFWNEFKELEEWWFYYKPIHIHKEYKDFILKELLITVEHHKHLTDKGNSNKWREMCIK